MHLRQLIDQLLVQFHLGPPCSYIVLRYSNWSLSLHWQHGTDLLTDVGQVVQRACKLTYRWRGTAHISHLASQLAADELQGTLLFM